LVSEDPDRLVWGGDWPHPRMDGEMPDAGVRHRILVANPARRYGLD
jgi:predicted TIM-barrel fold metal-dependent hydrolase